MGGTQTAEIYWRLGCQSCAEVDSEAKGEEIAFISFCSPVHCYLKIEYIRFLRENVWKQPWTLLSGVLSLFQKVYNNVHNHINTSKMAITNVCANCVILARGVVGFFFSDISQLQLEISSIQDGVITAALNSFGSGAPCHVSEFLAVPPDWDISPSSPTYITKYINKRGRDEREV